MKENTPLPSDTEFVSPKDIDVKCGRGRESFQHPGNSLLRIRVATKLEEYQHQTDGRLKGIIVDSVISLFFAEGARFLKRDGSTKPWYDGGIKAARERVGSAFRDASRPNKVKCMEKLKTQMSNTGHLGHILHPSPIVNAALLDPESSSISPSVAASGVDFMRRSTLLLKERSVPTGMVESRRHNSLRPAHDHRPYPGHILVIDAASDLFRFQQAVGDQNNAPHFERKDSYSTINMEDAKSVLHEVGSDDGTYSTTLIEDIDDIDEHQPFTLEDKEFLVALDWET